MDFRPLAACNIGDDDGCVRKIFSASGGGSMYAQIGTISGEDVVDLLR